MHRLYESRPGLVLKTVDKKTGKKVFINLVCHELVKRPLDASDSEVADDQLDKFGIRNLRVPLDVGDPKPSTDKSGDAATKCDVIFHPCLVERASSAGPMQEYFITELANLSLSWVAKEMETVVRIPPAQCPVPCIRAPLPSRPACPGVPFCSGVPSALCPALIVVSKKYDSSPCKRILRYHLATKQ